MADISQLLGRPLVLVAHPDDEAVGCGVLLQRSRNPIVVFATDGAPHDRYFWEKHGSRMQYQRLREEEACNALSAVGVTEVEFMGAQPLANGDSLTDQTLHLHLSEAHRVISGLIVRCRASAVVTMAYEGGHPDHDCCSILAAYVAARHRLPVWEFPLYYRPSSGEIAFQNFLHSGDDSEIILEPTAEERARKKAMLEAYSSQGAFLVKFHSSVERFRPQPKYDYSRPPHPGTLNYEAWKWTVSGADVCAAYMDFAAKHSAVAQ